MKIEKHPSPPFEPIVITLETKAEADNFWHVVNRTNQALETYAKHYGISIDLASSSRLWQAFSSVHAWERGHE